MAILSLDQVKNIALSDVDEWINTARHDSTKLMLHYYGVGTDEFLSIISGLENDDQLALRKKHAISNKFVTENLLRPMDNIWLAKGGAVTIDIDDSVKEKFLIELSNVKDGYSLKNYLKDIWKDKFITDPNGVSFVEVSKDGENAYLTQKSIFNIKNMSVEGMQPGYICFEPHVQIEEKEKIGGNKTDKKQLWVVDEAKYYLIEVKDDQATLIEEKINSFGVVPAVINSSIVDTLRKIKISPIHKQIELLDSYLVKNSVKEVYQFLHGYPIFWMYAQPCKNCGGTGFVDGEVCPSCNGDKHSAKKDVSDVIALKPPTETGQPIIAPDVAGYVQPDLATMGEQRTELDWTWNNIYHSLWGTTIERKDNETATGRFIDAQPVNNKLNDLSDIIEIIHSKMIDLLGRFYYPNSYKSNNVSNGRRFLIETPDQVWEKYISAKKNKAPVSSLDQLLYQYYESEYQKNELLQAYYLKLIKIEPFVHSEVADVISMPISNEDKAMKIYFSDWIKTKMINEVIDKNIEELKNDLKIYVESKTIENE